MTLVCMESVHAAGDQNKLNTERFIDGARGFYYGYYKSFYKKSIMPEGMQNCLDSTTIDNLYKFEQKVLNPFRAATELFDISKDLTFVKDGGEVLLNLANCHFETSFWDIIG